jgi:hypothetical protein
LFGLKHNLPFGGRSGSTNQIAAHTAAQTRYRQFLVDTSAATAASTGGGGGGASVDGGLFDGAGGDSGSSGGDSSVLGGHQGVRATPPSHHGGGLRQATTRGRVCLIWSASASASPPHRAIA